MQTFLPSINFEQSAKWLDNQRLGKQRVECLQILKALTDPSYGWQSHPAVRMWRGHSYQLVKYAIEICIEWTGRGYKDTCADKILDWHTTYFPDYPNMSKPDWLTEEFTSNHRAILLGKADETLSVARSDEIKSWRGAGSFNDIAKAKRKHDKAIELAIWYQQWGWTEQPAERNDDGKWPYLWPVVSEVQQ